MKEHIAQQGIYVGEVMRFSGLTGAVEIIEPTRPGELVKVMPNAVDLPVNYPARRGYDRASHNLRRVASSVVQLSPQSPVEQPAVSERKQAPAASLEEVQTVSAQAEAIVRNLGRAWEHAPYIRSYKVSGIRRDAVPEAARQYLGFGSKQIDCELVTDSRDGKTSVSFRQISAPYGYPGYFKDNVTYNLSDAGQRVVEATFMNTQILLEVPNPDHPSSSASIEQPEAQQLAQLLSSFEATE